ncbi:MAG: hypothetical protein GC154_12655 [bacterium]|nr:hypothetical protein [bacterium]
MRVFLVLFCCLLVAGIVAITVLHTPEMSRKAVDVKRIALSVQPRPVPEGGRHDDAVLDLFPEIDQSVQQEIFNAQANDANAMQPGQTTSNRQPVSDETSDKARLMALINDWTYTNYSQLGQKKIGTINSNSRSFEVLEGETLDNGVVVNQLTDEQATLVLGEAAFALRLAKMPDFFKDIRTNPRAMTREEQVQAYEYYMKRYGDKFKEWSKAYQPLPGMEIPKRISPEQHQKGMEEYQKRYGQMFQKQREMYPVPTLYPEELRANFREYWQKNHPNHPMPDFDSIESVNQLGPAQRQTAPNDSNQ